MQDDINEIFSSYEFKSYQPSIWEEGIYVANTFPKDLSNDSMTFSTNEEYWCTNNRLGSPRKINNELGEIKFFNKSNDVNSCHHIKKNLIEGGQCMNITCSY